jgi:hypothetical protein
VGEDIVDSDYARLVILKSTRTKLDGRPAPRRILKPVLGKIGKEEA